MVMELVTIIVISIFFVLFVGGGDVAGCVSGRGIVGFFFGVDRSWARR